jgi:quercetin dioxygenase-like cupin family protein
MQGYIRPSWAAVVVGGAALACASGMVFGQDAVKVAPSNYKVLQDNPQVRVLDAHIKPGEKVPMHSHPNHVVYSFSPGKVRFTSADGKTTESEATAGESTFHSAETHMVENIGDTEVHVLDIELKPASPMAANSMSPMSGNSMSKQAVEFRPEEMQWQSGPPALPTGVQMAVLEGNPQQPGPFTVRFKASAGYKVPPHMHSADEHVTVISGAVYLGMGDQLDEAKSQAYPAGSFTVMPAGMHHFALTRDQTIIQVHGMGPWDIKYINPADDPRLTPTGREEK